MAPKPAPAAKAGAKPVAAVKTAAGVKKAVKTHVFTVDCSKPVSARAAAAPGWWLAARNTSAVQRRGSASERACSPVACFGGRPCRSCCRSVGGCLRRRCPRVGRALRRPTLRETRAAALTRLHRPQVEDKIMEVASFEKFLAERIKVDNKTGQLGTSVTVSREKSKVTVTSEVAMSKRYLKYLTKKCEGAVRGGGGSSLTRRAQTRYLKKHNVRDWLRVVASNKDRHVYELRYFNIVRRFAPLLFPSSHSSDTDARAQADAAAGGDEDDD